MVVLLLCLNQLSTALEFISFFVMECKGLKVNDRNEHLNKQILLKVHAKIAVKIVFI